MTLLSSLFVISCSKDEPGPQHEDPEHYYEFTVSGAESGTSIGRPGRTVCLQTYLCNFDFSNDNYGLLIAGTKRYREDGSGTYTTGVPLEELEDGSWTIKKGKYAITPHTTLRPRGEGYSENSFYVRYNKSGKIYGETEITDGNITITNSGKGFYEGTFEFVTNEWKASSDSKITVKGKFRQKL